MLILSGWGFSQSKQAGYASASRNGAGAGAGAGSASTTAGFGRSWCSVPVSAGRERAFGSAWARRHGTAFLPPGRAAVVRPWPPRADVVAARAVHPMGRGLAGLAGHPRSPLPDQSNRSLTAHGLRRFRYALWMCWRRSWRKWQRGHKAARFVGSLWAGFGPGGRKSDGGDEPPLGQSETGTSPAIGLPPSNRSPVAGSSQPPSPTTHTRTPMRPAAPLAAPAGPLELDAIRQRPPSGG